MTSSHVVRDVALTDVCFKGLYFLVCLADGPLEVNGRRTPGLTKSMCCWIFWGTRYLVVLLVYYISENELEAYSSAASVLKPEILSV